MDDLLRGLGLIAGTVGLLLVAAGAGARLTGNYWLGSFQAGTLLLAGTAALVAGCFFLLLLVVRRDRR